MRDGGGWKRLDGCSFFFFFLFLNRCGLRLDYLVSASWLSGCDHTAYSTAQAAMMEMSNAQSLFGLSLCAVCVCVCVLIWSEESESQGVFPASPVTSTWPPRAALPASLFCLSVCSRPSSRSLSLSGAHTQPHTDAHALLDSDGFSCRSRLQRAINLSGCNIQETFETTSKLPAVKTD